MQFAKMKRSQHFLDIVLFSTNCSCLSLQRHLPHSPAPCTRATSHSSIPRASPSMCQFLSSQPSFLAGSQIRAEPFSELSSSLHCLRRCVLSAFLPTLQHKCDC